MYKKVSLTHTKHSNDTPRQPCFWIFSLFLVSLSLSLYLTHFLSCSFPFYFSKRVCETKKKEKEKRKKRKKERKRRRNRRKRFCCIYNINKLLVFLTLSLSLHSPLLPTLLSLSLSLCFLRNAASLIYYYKQNKKYFCLIQKP